MGDVVTFSLSQLKHVLLDIEGTVSDIRFVYETMFPYAKENMRSFLESHWQSAEVQNCVEQVVVDAGLEEGTFASGDESADIRSIHDHLQELMASDSKATGLKGLQGLVWKQGFLSGAITAELFEDVLPAIDKWRASGLKVSIYSSGSVLAQRLFFGHTPQGDLTGKLTSFFDTTTGKKQEVESYVRIASSLGAQPAEVLFVSDVGAELIAAQSAGVAVVASLRDGNKPLDPQYSGPAVTSFAAISIQ